MKLHAVAHFSGAGGGGVLQKQLVPSKKCDVKEKDEEHSGVPDESGGGTQVYGGGSFPGGTTDTAMVPPLTPLAFETNSLCRRCFILRGCCPAEFQQLQKS